MLGAALIEAWDLHTAIHVNRGFPWKKRGRLKLAPYLTAAAIRLLVSAALTGVYAASGQLAGVLSAVTVGVAAPKILQSIARRSLGRPAGEIPAQASPPGEGTAASSGGPVPSYLPADSSQPATTSEGPQVDAR
ncbi:hypothetical protein [Streptomyces sp. H51]|uniref:hypothetical protein n=1 Tax=Streptomyces sp. H51 TaxID=3111770 RepID=UPI002D7A217A|nr:hypothetical protein [Streptomyces sp. H51]